MSTTQENVLPAPARNSARVWAMRASWLTVYVGAVLRLVFPVPVPTLVMGIGLTACGLFGIFWLNYWVNAHLWWSTRHLPAEERRQAFDDYATSGVRRVYRLVFATFGVLVVLLGIGHVAEAWQSMS